MAGIIKYFLRPHKMLVRISQLLLVLIFSISAIGKLLHPESFFSFLIKTSFAEEFIVPIYYLVLIFEIYLSVSILLGLNIKTSARMTFALLTVFTLVIIYALIRGLSANCGCFGDIFNGDIGVFVILRNMIFMLTSLIVIRNTDKTFSIRKNI